MSVYVQKKCLAKLRFKWMKNQTFFREISLKNAWTATGDRRRRIGMSRRGTKITFHPSQFLK
jgi:hypothetical protein